VRSDPQVLAYRQPAGYAIARELAGRCWSLATLPE
jgi:hypothetical protein